MTEAQLINLMKEWKDEVKGLVKDYGKLTKKLEKAVDVVEASEKKPFVVYKTHITIAVTVFGIILTILSCALIMRHANLCVVNINPDGKGFAIQSCENVNKDLQKQINDLEFKINQTGKP